jgi:hypothetical protein
VPKYEAHSTVLQWLVGDGVPPKEPVHLTPQGGRRVSAMYTGHFADSSTLFGNPFSAMGNMAPHAFRIGDRFGALELVLTAWYRAGLFKEARMSFERASSSAFSLLVFSLAVGCYSSAPGIVRTSEGNPLVVVGAGKIEVGSGGAFFARYIVDRTARVCWFLAGESVGAMDCCSLARVPAAREFITWVDGAACGGQSAGAPAAAASPRRE